MSNQIFLDQAFETILKNTPDMMFFKDANLVYRACSMPFAKMAGLNSREEVVGKTDFEIFPTEFALEYTEDDKRVLKNAVSIIDKIEPILAKDGEKRYSSTSKYIICDEKGNITGLCGVARDVTAEITLREEVEHRVLSNQMFDDVLEADITENRMVRAEGSALVECGGVNVDASFTAMVELIVTKHMHPDYAKEMRELYDINRLFNEYSSGNKRFSHIAYQTVDGENYRWVELTSRLYFSAITGTLRITTFFKDLDDEIRKKEQLRKTAETDSMTGLLNRKSTIDQINECVSGYGRADTHALLFVDLDMFKQINDKYGHKMGDIILVETASKLRTLFRKDDIVGRVGGDEFLVLLKNIANIAEAEKLASEIFNIVPTATTDSGLEISATCSVGISMYTANGKTFEQLFDEADRAMYSAKQTGRNRLVVMN